MRSICKRCRSDTRYQPTILETSPPKALLLSHSVTLLNISNRMRPRNFKRNEFILANKNVVIPINIRRQTSERIRLYFKKSSARDRLSDKITYTINNQD